MKLMEVKAVADLKRIIKRIENGEFDITDCGTSVRVEETNISTDDGVVGNVSLQYEIRHTVIK